MSPLLLWLTTLCVALTGANIRNATITDFSKCDVYYSRSGHAYKDFFAISEDARGKGNDTLDLDFHFSVLAPSDAHILLAPSSQVTKSDPVYEIVIGAGDDTFSDIRRAQKSDVMASMRTKDMLSALDVRSFWIHITRGGSIEVGREGEELSFLSWQDSDLLPLSVFSFSTWTGIEAKWFYNCPDETKASSGRVLKKLTDVERLRQDLLTQYNPYVRPVPHHLDYTTVTMEFATHYINLDDHKSTMDVRGTIKLEWQDDKLKWDPSEYGYINTLRVFRGDIWKPDLIVMDGVGGLEEMLGDTMIVVNNRGTVQWNPRAHFVVWCPPEGLGSWPSDRHECSLEFSFRQDHSFMMLEFNANTSNILSPSVESQWEILEVRVDSNFGSQKEVYLYDSIRSLEIAFKLKRLSETYTVVFFTPFIVIGAMVMATFCVSPFGSLKILLGSLQLLLTSLLIVGLAYYIPAHPENVPFLVQLYSYTLLVVMIDIVLSVLVINLSRKEHEDSLPNLLCRFLNSSTTRFIFWIPRNLAPSEEYGSLNSGLTIKAHSTIQDDWISLGIFIDRISFVVYLCLFITAICLRH